MIFNEIDINRKLFEPVFILIALYFDPGITHANVGRTNFFKNPFLIAHLWTFSTFSGVRNCFLIRNF